ncbi:hypothetical protein ACROYT_G007989 [Oculina patagonica]
MGPNTGKNIETILQEKKKQLTQVQNDVNILKELLVILFLFIVVTPLQQKISIMMAGPALTVLWSIKEHGGIGQLGCHRANLNGLYHHGQHSSGANGVNWRDWKGYNYSAKRAEMLIRPVHF